MCGDLQVSNKTNTPMKSNDVNKTTEENKSNASSSKEKTREVHEIIETLRDMHQIILSEGMYPADLQQRDKIHHTVAEQAVVDLCKKKKVVVSPSLYNPEVVEYERAKSLAEIHDNERITERKKEIILRSRGEDVTRESLSNVRDDEIELITDHDVVESYRYELRIARQGAERSMTAPNRTRADGWGKTNVRYGYNEDRTFHNLPTIDDSGTPTSEDGGFKYEWGMSIPIYSNSAKLYEIHYENENGQEESAIVYLDIEALKAALKSNISNDNITINESGNDVFGINGTIRVNQNSDGHVMLHAFNTKYSEITKDADKIAQNGISYVLVSPPLTWRADGLYTPDDEKGMWYHCYQPEDLRSIDNPLGNLQEFKAMINILANRGIGVIADVPLNFMGIGGDGGAGGVNDTGTLVYPSTDIRTARTEKIKKIAGAVEGQQLIRAVHYRENNTDMACEQFLNTPYTSEADFEQAQDDVSDWSDITNIQHHRLNGMPKILGNSPWMIGVQKQYLISLRDLGVKGYRIDAEKHMTSDQFNGVFGDASVTQGMFIFGETITPGHDSTWSDYLKPRLGRYPNIGAYDFPLQNTLIDAFKFGGDIQRLKMISDSSPSGIFPGQSVTFTVNHDIPNNGPIFSNMLFGHPADEVLANAYILSLPGRTPLLYSDGRALDSKVSIKLSPEVELGGDAWMRNWWNKPENSGMIQFHNKFHDSHGIWFAWQGNLATSTCLAFSRGKGTIEENDHTGLVIINKSDQNIQNVNWPNKLLPGTYEDLGPNGVNSDGTRREYQVNERGELPDISVPGRMAIMLSLKD